MMRSNVFILSFLIISLFLLTTIADSKPLWKEKSDFRWHNIHSAPQGNIMRVSSPLLDNGLAELKIEILEDGNFSFQWMKEGGDKTYLRFYINNNEESQCSDSVLASYSPVPAVKNGDILRWLFTANDQINATASVVLPQRSEPSEQGIIFVQPLELNAPNSFCVNEPGLEAWITELPGANYHWKLSDGELTSGQNTSKIVWTSGNDSCNIKVKISSDGIEKNLSKNITVDRSCIYLNYCDDLNKNIRSNQEIRLLCGQCGDRQAYLGNIIIENIFNLSVISSCSSQYAALKGSIEIGNSSSIFIKGLNIANSDGIINVDNLSDSTISSIALSPSSRGCAIRLHDSENNTLLGNDIHCHNGNISITIVGGENNTIKDCLDRDKIREKIFYNNGSIGDITCWTNNYCYTCNITGTDKQVDIKRSSRQNWMDLDGWQNFCTS